MTARNKKIFLLYPPISKLERYSSEIGSAGGEQIPLGIYYLAAYLREHDYVVKVRDAEATHRTAEQILSEIKDFDPAYLGISSTTVAFHRALEIAKAVKSEFPHIVIIIGGPHVTACPEQTLSFSEFDFGVPHEGEITLLELLDTLNDSKPVENVKGVLFRDNEGKVVATQKREYISDLDALPFPAYDLIEDIAVYSPPPCNYKTLPVINIITSRGCPNQCTFCDNNIFGRKYRQRSAENIVAEIAMLRKTFGIKEIQFADDTFLIDKNRLYKLFEICDQQNIRFYFTCSSRINNTDYELLKFLKAHGCWHISFGIESGDENILKIIKKNISLEKAREVVNQCRKLGIKSKGFFIIGHPGETLNTINKTIKLACSLKLDDIVATINTPIPGSEQYAEAKKYGVLDESNWAEFNYWRPVFVPFGLTKEFLIAKHREIYRKFYFRPRIIARYLMSFFGRGGWKRFVMVFKASFFVIHGLFGKKEKP